MRAMRPARRKRREGPQGDRPLAGLLASWAPRRSLRGASCGARRAGCPRIARAEGPRRVLPAALRRVEGDAAAPRAGGASALYARL